MIRLRWWLRRIGYDIIGWTLLIVGVILMPLPGPGTLIVVTGLIVLAQNNPWAERKLAPVKRQAFRAAREGVRTWLRVVMSALGAMGVVGVGVIYLWSPPAPGVWPLGERWWLFGGTAAGVSIITSGLVALGLLIYSVKRFRWDRDPLRRARATEA